MTSAAQKLHSEAVGTKPIAWPGKLRCEPDKMRERITHRLCRASASSFRAI